VLEADELAFYDALPETIAVWRGCEAGRERGLSWTIDRSVAEGFAIGKRCINRVPTLVRADIPKQHVFAVFSSRNEHEITLDPRRLRRLTKEALSSEQIAVVKARLEAESKTVGELLEEQPTRRRALPSNG